MVLSMVLNIYIYMIIPLMPKLFSGFWAKGNRSDQQTNRWPPVTSPDSFHLEKRPVCWWKFPVGWNLPGCWTQDASELFSQVPFGYPIVQLVFLALVLRSNRSTCSQPPVDDGKWHTQLTTPISQTHSDMFLTCVYVCWLEKGKN